MGTDEGATSDSSSQPEADLENDASPKPKTKDPIRFGWIVGVKVSFHLFIFTVFMCNDVQNFPNVFISWF